MSGYVVMVDFHLKPGARERFRELVGEQCPSIGSDGVRVSSV